MGKEKVTHTFEVIYQEANGIRAVVPVNAQDFRIRDGYIAFSIDEEDVCAFRNWISVKKIRSRESSLPPFEFPKMQLELLKKKKP